MKFRVAYFVLVWLAILWAVTTGPLAAVYVLLVLNVVGVCVVCWIDHRAMLSRLDEKKLVRGWVPNKGQENPGPPPLGGSVLSPLARGYPPLPRAVRPPPPLPPAPKEKNK